MRPVLEIFVKFEIFLKVSVNEKVSFTDHVFYSFWMTSSWPWTGNKTITSEFANMTSLSHYFDVAVFILSSLVTGASFMPISWLVLKLWSFSFIKDWPEIRKWEILLPEFCPLSRDWGRLGIPNLAQLSLIKNYCMLQKFQASTFTISELIWENQQGGGDKITSLPLTQNRLNWWKTLLTSVYLLQKRKLNIKIEQQFNTKY